MFRIGHGYDVHELVTGRKLIIGGVTIPFEYGLLGHSDADVLIHSVCDAILGAAALGDIGKHFPDTDNRDKGISSVLLLKHCNELINNNGYSVYNIDATVVAQKPKLAPYIDEMRKIIADACQTDISFVSVKATTEEGLGFTGKLQGISSTAVVLINENK